MCFITTSTACRRSTHRTLHAPHAPHAQHSTHAFYVASLISKVSNRMHIVFDFKETQRQTLCLLLAAATIALPRECLFLTTVACCGKNFEREGSVEMGDETPIGCSRFLFATLNATCRRTSNNTCALRFSLASSVATLSCGDGGTRSTHALHSSGVPLKRMCCSMLEKSLCSCR